MATLQVEKSQLKWEGYVYGKIGLFLNPDEGDFLTVRVKLGESKISMIHIVVLLNRVDLVTIVIEKGANVDDWDSERATPFHFWQQAIKTLKWVCCS